MSNSSKKDKELEKIDEEQAYFELCQIIAEAIQTQDINLLNSRITEWKRKYPWDKFSKSLKAKIEYILNQYYSELIQYIIKSIKQQDEKREFDQRKALLQLYKMIKNTNDLKMLEKKVVKWKSEYPIDDFMKMYEKKARIYTSEKYLKENAFDQEKAFYDLYYTLKTNSTFEELKIKVANWEMEYSIGDKFAVEDFIKRENDVRHLLNEEYLNSISTDSSDNNASANYNTSLSKQQNAYDSLIVALSTNDNSKVFDWVYKNRNITFNSFYRNQILVQTAFKYPISILESNPELKLDLSTSDLSFDEFKNIDDSRKFIIIKFIKSLMDDHSMPGDTFETALKKSELAKSKSFLKPISDEPIEAFKPSKESIEKSEPKVKTKNDTEETKPIIEPLVIEPELEPETEVEAKSNTEETKPIIEPLVIEPELEPETEVQAKSDTEETKPIIEPLVIEPELEPETEVQAKSDTEETKPIIEPLVIEPELEPETEVQAKSDTEETKPIIEPLVIEPELEPETEVEAKSDTEETKPIIEPLVIEPEHLDFEIKDTPKSVNFESVDSEETSSLEETPTIKEISPQIEFSDTPLFEIESDNLENISTADKTFDNIKPENNSTADEISNNVESLEFEPFDLIYKKSQLAKATILVEDTIDEKTTSNKKISLTNLFKFKNRNEIP